MTVSTPPLPKRQSAIVADKTGELYVSQNVALPALAPDGLLLKTVAVAVNPVDVKLTGPMAIEGAIAGSDVAGIVVGIGSEVPPGRFAIGERVAAVLTSMDPETPLTGAWAEYVGATVDCSLKIPQNMSFESASTLGIGVATMGYALFQSLQVPGYPEKPAKKPQHVLVYGGSTSSGTIAIQLIRKSGLIPITTCSPRNFALVESYGAEKAFDYNDPDSISGIKAYTKNALDYALDCFCEGDSMRFCYGAIGRAGGRYTTLEPFPEHQHTRKRVKPEFILGPALLGKHIAWKDPYTIEAKPELRIFGREWFLTAERLLESGELRPHPARVSEKVGFEGILNGIQFSKKKAVSGEKLVYRVVGTKIN